MIEIKLENVAAKDETETALNGKVDKITGKSLSTNDYTNTEKDNVTSAYIHSQQTGNPHGTSMADITGLVSAIDGKVDKVTGKGLSTEDFTTAEKTKLAVIDMASKADLIDGKVPSSQLPSFVDDVLEYTNFASLPSTGESGKIYVTLNDNKTWRWGGSSYVQVNEGVVLGETSSTAYRGDRGKAAYDHSQATGNPHGTAMADISGLVSALAALQPLLVSGTNIKTIGGVTLLGSGDISVSAAVPQTNKIFVDSNPFIGADSTGRGRVDAPYLTVEYALSDNNNTGSVTATTTNSSNVLTSVSSTSNIAIGQVITGAGIPYDSVVVSKTSNTITLSRNCTASATITATWYTFYEINTNGSFTWTSNWLKRGFIFNLNESRISFSGLVFSITSSYDVYFSVIGGHWNGTSSASQFISSNYITNSANFVILPKTYYSIGTGFQFVLANASAFNNLIIDAISIDCRFGSIADLYGTRAIIRGYKYGLLRGIRTYGCNLDVFGITETPASINAMEPQQGTITKVFGEVIGQINCSQAGASSVFVLNANANGTAHTFRVNENAQDTVLNGNIVGNVTFEGTRGNLKCNGSIEGNVTNNMVYSTLSIRGIKGTYTASNTSTAIISGSQKLGSSLTGITLTGGAVVFCEGTFFSYQRTYSGAACGVSIGIGCRLELNNENQIVLNSLDGTLVNNGYLFFLRSFNTTGITGRFENNGTIEITRATQPENVDRTPYIQVGSGTFISNIGKLFCPHSDSKSGLIRKTATGGKVVLINTWLHVANNLHPIQILSNTGTAQDVIIEGCKTDYVGNMALAFSDTTYGATYAPNYKGSGLSIQQNVDYAIL